METPGLKNPLKRRSVSLPLEVRQGIQVVTGAAAGRQPSSTGVSSLSWMNLVDHNLLHQMRLMLKSIRVFLYLQWTFWWSEAASMSGDSRTTSVPCWDLKRKTEILLGMVSIGQALSYPQPSGSLTTTPSVSMSGPQITSQKFIE